MTWPSLLDFYVYGEPTFFFYIFIMLILPWYIRQKREYIRRLIIEQPT